MFGLFAYPALGIYQSLVKGKMSKAQHAILQARIAQDAYMSELKTPSDEDIERILHNFRGLNCSF